MYINKNLIIGILVVLLLILWWYYAKTKWLINIDKNMDTWSYVDTQLDDSDIFGSVDWSGNAKWSENYKQLFVDACIEEWQWDSDTWTWDEDSIDFVSYCNCVADRLEAKYTIPQFLQQMDEDPDLNFMFDEVWECL